MRNRLMVTVALLALFAAAPARAEMKLAYVDVQRALNECEAGKTAKAQFRVKVEGVEKQLQEEQNEVASLKDELEKKGMPRFMGWLFTRGIPKLERWSA